MPTVSCKKLFATCSWGVREGLQRPCEASQVQIVVEIKSSIATWNERLTVNGWSCSFCRWTSYPGGWSWCFRSLTFICKKVATYGFGYVCLISHVTTNEAVAKACEGLAKVREGFAKPREQVAEFFATYRIYKKVATYGFSYVCLISHVTTNEAVAKAREGLAKACKGFMKRCEQVAKSFLQRIIHWFTQGL